MRLLNFYLGFSAIKHVFAEDDDDDSTSTTSGTVAATTKSEDSVTNGKDVFVDTPYTTTLWQLVAKSDATKTDEALEAFLFSNPELSVARSADHRGGLWWAWEYKNIHALAALQVYAGELLSKQNEPHHPHETEKDKDGFLPKQMCIKSFKDSVISNTDDDEDDDIDDIDQVELNRRKKARENKQKEKNKIKNASDSEIEEICNDLMKKGQDEKGFEELKKEIAARRITRQEMADKELDVDDDHDDDDDDDSGIRIHKSDKKEKSPASKSNSATLNVDVDEDEDEEM